MEDPGPEGIDTHPAYSLFDEGYIQHLPVSASRTTGGASPRPRAPSSPKQEYIVTRGSSYRTSFGTDSISEEERIIDGRFSISAADMPSDYVRIEVSQSWP